MIDALISHDLSEPAKYKRTVYELKLLQHLIHEYPYGGYDSAFKPPSLSPFSFQIHNLEYFQG